MTTIEKGLACVSIHIQSICGLSGGGGEGERERSNCNSCALRIVVKGPLGPNS